MCKLCRARQLIQHGQGSMGGGRVLLDLDLTNLLSGSIGAIPVFRICHRFSGTNTSLGAGLSLTHALLTNGVVFQPISWLSVCGSEYFFVGSSAA